MYHLFKSVSMKILFTSTPLNHCLKKSTTRFKYDTNLKPPCLHPQPFDYLSSLVSKFSVNLFNFVSMLQHLVLIKDFVCQSQPCESSALVTCHYMSDKIFPLGIEARSHIKRTLRIHLYLQYLHPSSDAWMCMNLAWSLNWIWWEVRVLGLF